MLWVVSDRGAIIVHARDEQELDRIIEPSVQAVIYQPPSLPAWLGAVAGAVERGALAVPRTTLASARRDELAAWLEHHVPVGAVADEVRAALIEDVLAMSDRLAIRTGGGRFLMRIFTGAPSTECGFHVDTVPPGAPVWGLLRVYNGAGTAYIEPDNLDSVAAFYRYLGRRERLARERREARAAGDGAAAARLESEIVALDARPAFLHRPQDIHVAPAGAIVAFKHLDIRLHWSSHGRAAAWIHCSPMAGAPRLVVNLTVPQAVPRSARPAPHVSAR
ncbi:MAG: DUF1826 domain-containing protein [Deltaproteobacteria bacterium]|nr:MAG: DUF1826 domain-containing protein [Deltaproteobacteria bacterium]TMQ06378.1 MAG: DUF1826 domain-containing protein [Deltaproteobacteria bacterium]